MCASARFRLLATAAILLLAAAAGRAVSPLTEAESAKARQLVQQLGSADYRLREQASSQLIRMGSAVEGVLREGLDAADPEIRARCRSILPLALSYDLERRLLSFLAGKEDRERPAPAGWTRFKAIVGDDSKSRQVFAAMHRHDGEFLTELDKSPGRMQDRMEARCMDFMQAQNYGRGAVDADQIAVILFAALDPKLKINSSTQAYLNGALQSLAGRKPTRQLMKSNLTLRKLLLKYLTDGPVDYTVNALTIVARLELSEAVEFARAVLKNADSHVAGKGAALGVLGHFGGKAVIGEILPFLEDATSVGEAHFGNQALTAQLRDVALAALVQATGQSLLDYEFGYFKQFAGQASYSYLYLSPGLFGFSDNATREAALKKWKVWYEANKINLSMK